MSPSARICLSWLKMTQWAAEWAGATKGTTMVVAMVAVEATEAAFKIVVDAAAVVVEVAVAVVAIMTITIVAAGEAGEEVKATMLGEEMTWEVVAGDLVAETTRSSSQRTSAMHPVEAVVATEVATIAVTQAWSPVPPLSEPMEVVTEATEVETEATEVVTEAVVEALAIVVEGVVDMAIRRCTVSKLAASRSSKSHVETVTLFTWAI